MSDLYDQLSQEGIAQIRGFRANAIGIDQKVVCPRCGGGSSKERCLSVKLDNEGGAVWQCHRANCGWVGNIPGQRRVAGADGFRKDPKSFVRPEPPKDPSKPDILYAWFARRGISKSTVDRFGVYRARRFIPQMEAEVTVTVFPYVHAGELKNNKIRYDYKKADGSAAKTFIQERGAEPTLFNADALNADEIIFCEGEMDVMALHEAGLTNAVSLKDGAGMPGEKSEKRYEPLRTHWEALQECSRFVLAGDMDEPGRALVEELARRLGREKCRVVIWPSDCKDANETLMKHGADAVRACIASAAAYPIEGLWAVDNTDIAVLDDDRWMKTVSTGDNGLNEIFKIPSSGGRLFVFTGVPNSGKSTFTDWLLVQQARLHGTKAALFSPETSPWQLHAKRLMEIFIGKAWKTMTYDEKIKGIEFAGKHFTHIVPPSDDNSEVVPTLDWLVEQVRLAVLRDGVKIILMDPWNEIEHGKPANQSTTEYTNDAIRRIKQLCSRFDVHVFLVAHPRKTPPEEVPNGFHIADSAAFWNKADFGITVHRDPNDPPAVVTIHTWKIRFKAHGSKGLKKMVWNAANDRFSSVLQAPDQQSHG